ncbi:uncharacterized protein [Henckelia pumila]|uniref:uncharacterized protein n=1 Tax=Henckelia pumila TaxID=405737 RepID=UPI003C6E803F
MASSSSPSLEVEDLYKRLNLEEGSGGITVIAEEDGKKEDVSRVINDGPWTFDQHLLIFKSLELGMNPHQVPLFQVDFWIQVYDLPIGYMSERVARDVGNFLGKFVEADSNNFTGIWRDYMRIRVSMDIRLPIKRRMKLKKIGEEWSWINFKYEKIPTFCFFCGVIGHSDKFCEKLFDYPDKSVEKLYGVWLRAPSRRTPVDITGVTEDMGEKEREWSDQSKIIVETHVVNPSTQDQGRLIIADPKRHRIEDTIEIDHSTNGPQCMEVWHLTGFYSFPERQRRNQSWNLLRMFSNRSSLPWCCIGDFNDLLSQSEKRGRILQPTSLINGFRSAVEESGLEDLGMKGNWFTWERSRGIDFFVEERLDRAMATPIWLNLLLMAEVSNLEVVSSYHNAIFLNIDNRVAHKKKSFCFENAWIIETECKEMVQKGWMIYDEGDIQRRIETCGNHLYKHDENDAQLVEMKSRLSSLLAQEESFWKQRAKIFWLQEGDDNTKIFHNYASSLKIKNQIMELQDNQGNSCFWGRGMEELILLYFQELYSTDGCIDDYIISNVSRLIDENQNRELTRPYEEQEILSALKSMHKDKSPGPDGMNPGFFQHFWEITGVHVKTACMEFLNKGYLPEGINYTSIVLIPKKKRPETLSDIRPISLCNVIYKIVAKVVANRLKGVLNSIISRFQSAFTPGRSITDNVMISFEISHYLNRKTQGKRGGAALKIDMSKAYDRVEWMFLRNMMLRLGFQQTWVDFVMKCVSLVRYKVVHNGYEIGPIIPKRGLRQGDPLSPYLFLICTEGLSSLILAEMRSGNIHGIKVAHNAPAISNLFFADDSFLFFRATEEESIRVKNYLRLYEQASGKKVNYAKSSISFSPNMPNENKNNICEIFGVRYTSDHGKYLGVPSVIGRNKSEVFSFLKEKTWKRECMGGDINGCQERVRKFSLKQWSKHFQPMCKSKLYLEKFNGHTRANKERSKEENRNGQETNIWRDQWLPDLNNPYVETVCPQEDLQNSKVHSLRNSENGGWDSDILEDIFVTHDVRLIQSIPLSRRDIKDRWIWGANNNGLYTVKSGYKLFVSNSEVIAQDLEVDWKQIWRLKIPGKVKNFIWRTLSHCLPTRMELRSKHINCLEWCPMCNNHPETGIHVLVHCPFARSVWSLTMNGSSVSADSSFREWWKSFINSQRNSERVSKKQTVAQQNTTNWKAPPRDFLKCNVDAVFFTNPPRMGYGCVIRDSFGEVKAAIQGCFHGAFNPTVAEALGVREALSWIKELHLPKVIVESDAQLVINALQRKDLDVSSLGLLVEDCRFLASELHTCSFSFVRRSANRTAHSIARSTGSMSDSVRQIIHMPSFFL